MRKLLPLLAGTAVGLATVLVLYLVFLGGSRPLVCKESQDGWRYHTGQLPPHETVGQSFTSRLDGLARIEVKLGTFRKLKVAPLTLELVELDQSRPPDAARPWPVVDQGITVALFDQVQMGQTFVPLRDGLDGIWLMVDTTRMLPGSKVRLQVYRTGVVDLPGELLATSWAAVEELPAWGFHRFSFPPLENVKGYSLLFTVSVRGVPAKRVILPVYHPRDPSFGYKISHYLMVKFLSEKGQLNGRPWIRYYDQGETWRPEVTYGRSYGLLDKGTEDYYNRPFPWDYWKGDLVFAPAYPPALPDGPVIRTSRRSGWTVSDNIFSSFSFDPIPDSKGRAYYFRLSSPPGQGAGAVALADWAERYPSGALVVDGVPFQGGLAFRIYNAVEREQAVDAFVKRAVKNKPGLLGKSGFLQALVLLHLLLAGLLAGLFTALVLSRGKQA